MALSPGEQFGPYQLIAAVGRGGMGEVWKARDTRLDRTVAMKFSQEKFSERFEREARAISSLNHPNICQLYDVGPNFLVMEYIEGTSLKGPLPVDQALKYAVQICAALDHAHKKGITHRDLKPANVLVTKAGIKLLDFGLAKLASANSGLAPKPDDVTLTMALTEKNEIVGTLYYMSPEQLQTQATGVEIDARSDIFSFGLVLYEILTGKRAFEGSSPASVIAAILERPAPSIADVAPAALDRALQRCLVKDRDDRWQSATDLKAQLEWIESAPERATAAPSRSRLGMGAAGRVALGAAALFMLAFVAVSFVHFRETPPTEQTLRYTIAAPENGTVHSFAISPDGRTLVIAALVSGKRQLWLRTLDALRAQPMAFTDDAVYPFWSPDSRFIGFFAQGKLKKIAAGGGPALSLCDVTGGYGGSWNRDDVIVFAPQFSGISIQRISANGGTPTDVTKTKGAQNFPVFLPSDSHFLYESSGAAEKAGIWVSSLDGRENRRVLPDASAAVFAPSMRGERTGHLLFIREKTLMSAPFDPQSAQISGDAVPVADGVSLSGSYLPATASANGVLLYAAGGSPEGQNQIGWFDRSGKSLGPVGMPGDVRAPGLSPDEKLVAFARGSSGRYDLWVRNLSRGTETRFTSDASSNLNPFWSPRGDRIVFDSNRSGVYNLYQRATSGSGHDELLLPSRLTNAPTQWSRDGRFIVYQEIDSKTKHDLWVFPTEGATPEQKADPKPIPFLRTEADELFGQLSPDSRWMAFTSDRSGKREVYVRPFPSGDGEWTISLAGGQAPRWSGDGKEVFFEAADGKMMAVSVKAVPGSKPSFEAGAPVPLFDAHMVHQGADVVIEYDVTADGKHLLINATAGLGGGPGAASAPPLTVVTNWADGLKK
jgi:Tol biopolymer transport system component/tRNA A-37 threonylcarbamoyl transferase component Bud32